MSLLDVRHLGKSFAGLRALHDVSPSMSGSRSRSLSQKARLASRGSRFNDVISGSRDTRLRRGYGIERSLSRQPEDVPEHRDPPAPRGPRYLRSIADAHNSISLKA